MQQKEIGMQISAARKKLKYTRRELAEKLGVSDKTISKWGSVAQAIRTFPCFCRCAGSLA